jgi:hypothetical protein
MKAEELCVSCPSRSICTSLCPAAAAYVNQDYVPQREETIGIPQNIRRMPNRLANITPRVNLSPQQIDRLIRKLRRYKQKIAKSHI